MWLSERQEKLNWKRDHFSLGETTQGKKQQWICNSGAVASLCTQESQFSSCCFLPNSTAPEAAPEHHQVYSQTQNKTKNTHIMSEAKTPDN